MFLRELRGEAFYRAPRLREPHGVGGEASRPLELLREDHLEQSRQEVDVGAGPNEVMVVGDLGGLRAARVHQHELAAPGPDVGEPPLHVRRRHQRAVRGQGIAADEQEEVGAVHVGHGQEQLMTEHGPGGDVVRELIHGGGREAALGAERTHEGGPEEQRAQIVNGGVAEVDGDCVLAVLALHRGETLGGLV